MQISRAGQINGALFVSAKTSTAIPARCALVRDALVQASLDPAVRSIEFVPSARVGATPVDLGAIIIVRDDGRFYLDVVAARPLRDVEDEGLVLIALQNLGLTAITLTAADIQREPRFANSRLVWSYRLHPVGISMRMRVLQILADDGPMALSRLLSAVWSDRDPSHAAPVMRAVVGSLLGAGSRDVLDEELVPARLRSPVAGRRAGHQISAARTLSY
jgi:hypothetical protein